MKKIKSDSVAAEPDFDKNRQIITKADFTEDLTSVEEKRQEIEIDFINEYQISEPGLKSDNLIIGEPTGAGSLNSAVRLEPQTDWQIETNMNDLLDESNSFVELVKNRDYEKRIAEVGSSGEIIKIDPRRISIDERLNLRGEIDSQLVSAWSRLMTNGVRFPPVDLIKNSAGEWVAVDGMITLSAALEAGLAEIDARVLNCDLSFAFGVKIHKNSSHGLLWKTQERKPFVQAFLRNPKSANVKIRRIAAFFKVDNHSVATWKGEIENGEIPQNSPSGSIDENQLSGEDQAEKADSRQTADEPESLDEVGIDEKYSPRASKTSEPKKLVIAAQAVILQERWQVRLGDRFRIESPTTGLVHYALCAGSEDKQTWQPLFEQNWGAMVVTDPTYGTEVPSGRTYGNEGDKAYFENVSISPGELELLLLNVFANVRKCLRKGAIYYVFEGYYYRDLFAKVCDRMMGKHHMSMVWVKKDYIRPLHSLIAWDTEEALFGWVRGKKPHRLEGKGNVFLGCAYREDGQYSKRQFPEKTPFDVGGDYHSCSKPVYLLKEFIERYSEPGDLVIDPFSGSGSTGVGCELSGRRFFGVEIVPEYVAVELDRFERLGCTIHKMAPGEEFSFPEVSVPNSGVPEKEETGD
jgi:hypothetical protein